MLTTAVVYTWFLVHVGVLLVVSAWAVVVGALFPGFTARGVARLENRLWVPLLTGLAISIPVIVIAFLLLLVPNGAAKFIGAVVASLWVLVSLCGLAAVARRVGGGASLGAVFRGGLLMTLTWMLPFVGWFIALPLTLSLGLGCVVLGFRRIPEEE